MPLCPQITNTPITVTQTADFTVTSVIPLIANSYDGLANNIEETNAEAAAALAAAASATTTANSAAAVAGAAQSTANTALANAATAYTAAIGSLQPSASTIVNASNQMTAIAANGITVYSGSSATTGARVVLNSTGLAGFNSGGTATFSISASTGAAVFSGSVTGATITASTMNIGGNAIIDASGLLTATGATITGTINATAGYFGTSTNGFSISSTGLVGVGTGTIVGGTIQGATFNNGSGTFFVSSAGVVTAISGTIGGWSLTSTSISKTVGTKTMTLDSSNAILTITDTSSGIFAGGGINITSGSTTGSYGAGGFSFGGNVAVSLNSGNLYLQGGATSQIILSPGAGLGSTTYWVQIEGHLNSAAYTLSTGTYDTSSTASSTGTYLSATGAMIARRDNQIPIFAHRYNNTTSPSELIRLNRNGVDAGGITTTSGGVPAFRNASDYRLKSNIQDYVNSTQIIKGTRLRSFVFNTDPSKTEIGFIAHEFAEVLPDLVMGEKDAIDEDGNPIYQSITATSLIPYLTGALKDIILRVEALEEGK
jgi:hypothetical protein